MKHGQEQQNAVVLQVPRGMTEGIKRKEKSMLLSVIKAHG